jgi:hypothetical protein
LTEMRTKSYPAEDRCITLFELYLSQQGGVPVTVVSRPDRDGSGPAVARRCDALLEAPGRRWSVEHTSIDSFPQQRTLEARFIDLTGPLTDRLEPRVDCWVEILIDQAAIPPRREWAAIRDGLEAFVLANVPTSLEDDDLLVRKVVGIPVGLRTSPNDGVGQVTFYQLTPQALAAKSQDVFKAAIEHKKPVLEAYRTHGYETVLLFDLDRALATRHSALNALASLLPLCEPGIDDVYLIEAHRGHPGPPAVTWLKRGDRIAERCQPAWPTAPGYPIRPRSSR